MNSKVLSKLNHRKSKQDILYQNTIREVNNNSNLIKAFYATLENIEDDNSVH